MVHEFHCPVEDCVTKARRVLDIHRHLLNKHTKTQSEAQTMCRSLRKSSDVNKGYIDPKGATLPLSSRNINDRENTEPKKKNEEQNNTTTMVEALHAKIAQCVYEQERWRREEREARRELVD